ncbi:MAG TPA: DUF6485 family protein [bacterium]|nr:DUF6485 family protein [bacterium]
MKCSNRDINLKRCVCTYPYCQNHALCCECVAYHRKNGEIPGCFFPPEEEKTYDRSIHNFIKAWNNNTSKD